jgi:hypothetical protein
MPVRESSRGDSQGQPARGFGRKFTAIDTRPDMLNDHASSVAEHRFQR